MGGGGVFTSIAVPVIVPVTVSCTEIEFPGGMFSPCDRRSSSGSHPPRSPNSAPASAVLLILIGIATRNPQRPRPHHVALHHFHRRSIAIVSHSAASTAAQPTSSTRRSRCLPPAPLALVFWQPIKRRPSHSLKGHLLRPVFFRPGHCLSALVIYRKCRLIR